jgi:serine/threonine protein kinase
MSHSLESLLLGRTLVDRYLVEEVIGRGGMSVVYRARDQRLGRPIALKIVTLPAHDEAQRRSLRERFRREAGSAARIPPHPNVVQVYDYGTDPELDLDFIVMELLEGRDLKAAIRAGDLHDAEALRVIREAARGIAAGHRAGIVHRDVKPANVFLTGSNRLEAVKILDFGIAKAHELTEDEDLTLAGQVPHSPGYASPEQREPGRPLTPASDVYQLGLVAYELFSGARPFDEAERDRIRDGEHVPLPARGSWAALAPELRETIERALRPDPADRFPDASGFAEAASRVPDRWRAGDDETALAAGEDDHTMVAPIPTPRTPDSPAESIPRGRLRDDAPPVAVPPSRSPGQNVPRRASRFPWMPGQLAKFAAGIALALLGLWGLGLIGGDRGAGAPSEEAAALDVAALEGEFQALFHRAYRNLLEESAAEEGDEAAAAVGRVIADATSAFVQGDIDRHVSHYADRVSFHNESGVTRSRIERNRREDVQRYTDREIVIDRQAIEFTEPGRARALLDRTWEFSGPTEQWSGNGRQELILRLDEGRWRIVSERDLEIFSSTRVGS